MTQPEPHGSGGTKEVKLPRRDWIMLPMLSLLTACLMVGVTELIARRLFSYSEAGLKDCTELNDYSSASTYIPNCVCWEKTVENQPIEYRFNSSGYRSDVEFGRKPPGTYRIVLVGSSTAMGFGVPNDKSLAALLPKELSRRTGRPVEILNQAVIGGRSAIALRFSQALALNPDMVLWILTPTDLQHGLAVIHHPGKVDLTVPFIRRVWPRVKLAFATASSTSALRTTFDLTRTALLLRHYLFESQSQFVKSYLMNDDTQMGFLKAAPSREWKEDLWQLSGAAANFEAQAKAAGVPLVAVLVPNRAQAAMISMGDQPAGYDPYKLGEEVRTIISSQGGTYIDILPGFRRIPNPEQYYFPVDGHMDRDGHAILSGLLANELTSGAVAALSHPVPALRASM